MNQHQQATEFLCAMDADWANLIQTVGACQFAPKIERNPYEALVRAVAYQQLHTKAGDAIIGKFIHHFGQFPTPEQLNAAPFDDLRACGFSGSKIETIQGIAGGVMTGLVPSMEAVQQMSNAELIARLVSIKGIGQWTVEMMLMFTLMRMDILPITDFGVVEGYKRLKKLEAAPKPKQMAELGIAWSPHRTVASWYLWRVPK
ncbi:MAG: DNA-3-methyladenine glycosylase 2 family protein [Bdellovibrio sp.]|nr:DNA-3-methyladenine glycosylase 2 family protein [Methylotenera sp.]